ncbi:MAG: CbtA family protein [Rickettsiales bacterium]|jgi:cobalt transporter subunit CbtA
MQKILLTALIAGFIAGLVSFGIQQVKLSPLILQAETYEKGEHNDDHHHDSESWAPENGLERNVYSALANIGMGVGFAMMLIGVFVLRGEKMTTNRGILWGIAGFATFSLAPAFGLPPELPTTMAADLSERQIWWVATAIATAIGIYSLSFSKSTIIKIIAVLILAAPHIIGAPRPPLGGAVPTELNAAFAAASLGVSVIFWITLGAVSGWFYGRNTIRI